MMTISKKTIVCDAIYDWLDKHAKEFGCTKDNIHDVLDVCTFDGSKALWLQKGDDVDIFYDDYRVVYDLIARDGIDAFMRNGF